MVVKLVRDKKTGDYMVRSGSKHLGVLYEKHCAVLGQCWVFDVKTKGIFGRDAYFYSSPDLAKDWIPKEIRDAAREGTLYGQSISTFY